ncbi:hypothetical protein [Microcystis aeruginosa]
MRQFPHFPTSPLPHFPTSPLPHFPTSPHPTPHTPHPTPHTPSAIHLIYGTTRIKYRDNLGDY